jgi:hypothetical protein
MGVVQLSQDELDEIYAFAVDLGRKAGDLLAVIVRRHSRKRRMQ